MNPPGRLIRSIVDLSLEEVETVLGRSADLDGGAEPRSASGLLSLLFVTSSTRTAVGLAAAGVQLGLTPMQLGATRRDAAMSAAESLEDTVRTLAGYSRVVAYRGDEPCPSAVGGGAAVLNAGDGGRDGEHPSQALCDLYAIRSQFGDVSNARIGICGDLGMRATRSLLKQLDRSPPEQLVLIAPAARADHGVEFGPELAGRVAHRDPGDFSDLDVLYVGGLPARRGPHTMDAADRATFALTERTIVSLGTGAVVLSPMPIIDEIDPALRSDPRVRLFGPSDRSLHVRTALLELMLRRPGEPATRNSSR